MTATPSLDRATLETYWRAVFEQNSLAIIFGEGERIVTVNDAFLHLIGWTRADFEARPVVWSELTTLESQAASYAAYDEMMRTGQWSPYEQEYRRMDGTLVPVLIGGAMYDRESLRWVASIFDISKQRAAEQALARSQERLALAVRGSTDGVFDWDLTSDEVFLSPRGSAMMGVGVEGFSGASDRLVAQIHPDDYAGLRARIVEHFKQGVPFVIELRVRDGVGGWRWIQFRGEARRGSDGRAERMAGTVTDIHRGKEVEIALRVSEERYALAVRATSDGIYEFEEGATDVWISARAAELFEVPEASAGGRVTMTRIVQGFAPGDLERQREIFFRQVAAGEPYDLRVPRTKRSGEVQWIRVRGFAVEDAVTRRRKFVGNIADITEDVAAQERLRESEARFRQAQKMDALGTMASGIAHDFNNLLAAILGYVDVGLAAPTQNAERALKEVGTAGRRARDLVRQMLKFSRRGDASPPRVPLDVASAVDDVRSMVRATAVSNLTLDITIDPEVGAVLGEPGGLQQVLLNLATNAEHAMRSTGGTLRISAERVRLEAPTAVGASTLPPGAYVRLVVADTGTGIPADLLERVIEPFFTTKPQGEGTGLGLAVVHGIVASWGGALTITSVLREGTTVTLWLPRAEERVAPSDSGELRHAIIAPPGIGAVLVVDDEPAVLAVTAERLQLLGYTVERAASADEALTLLARGGGRYAALLTDLAIPHRSGEWLAGTVRAQYPELPVLLMTGQQDRLSEADVMALGARAVMLKPIGLAQLMQVMSSVLKPATRQ
ncbi:MAG: PAS domain-containing protein [Gemmatimonadaceae bacterium]|nr:PAS domain-containing protein [Gemmatimonadaceae bacterium]